MFANERRHRKIDGRFGHDVSSRGKRGSFRINLEKVREMSMNKISFGVVLLFISALAAFRPFAAFAGQQPNIEWNAETGQARLTTGGLELLVETKVGLNPRSLKNLQTGDAYADRDYSWPNGKLPALKNPPAVAKQPDGGVSITFAAKLGALEIEQTFTAPAGEPGAILESIAICNPTDAAIATADFKCGFAKCIRQNETFVKDADDFAFNPIPYRRETDGKIQIFPLREIAAHGMSYTGWFEPVVPTPIWGSEGWVWSKGSSSFLISKYNPDAFEWSLMEPVKQGAETCVRFAGAGQWKYGSPEYSTRLEAGKSCRFGETLLQAAPGDWKQAFYAYRRYVEGKGCKPPKDYNPPVHWNELYDTEYFPNVCGLCDEFILNPKTKRGFVPEFYAKNKELLYKFYSLDIIKGEAAKAKELGCEALYLDPGWDTGLSHSIWDAERLGSMESFVKTMREDYGLKVSLWASVAGVHPTVGDPAIIPIEGRVIDKDSKPSESLVCLSSPAFLETKSNRYKELAKKGAVFLMFDSDQFSGPCYDKYHGHQIPSTREEHARALLELARRVKKEYPSVLIEMHDFITGPGSIHYVPAYFGYARPHSFDCLWGHEFMWNVIDDLISRRAVCLYYYNLAFSIPIYLHINLKQDNANAFVFWWFASTCRHLGVGGKSPDPAVWEAQKKAMQTYKKLKRFYTQGEFYGLDEMIHVHTLPDAKEAVLNAFNLEDKAAQKQVKFRLADIGLPDIPVQIEGAAFEQKDGEITLNLDIPARGHVLYKIQGK
jgi:hypothetical protein